MIHLGDITKISGYKAPTVDTIIFGAPCQDLSVAGKRAGMKHTDMGDEETTRSGLFHEAVRIIKEMREHDKRNGRTGESIRPRYGVYENVPGAFSSNKGCDFQIVLQELIKVADPEATSVPVPEKGWPTSGCIMGDNWSVAWRVLDAQFWGVPQRRRRIALVADFGGQSAPEILFIRKGVSRDLDESQQARKATAGDVREGFGGAVGCDLYNGALSGDKAVTLNTNTNATGAGPTVISVDQHILDDQGGCHIHIRTDGKSPTLRAEMHGNIPAVLETYQKVTGPLMANSHPGSYTGQDAYSDMLIAGPVCEEPIVIDRAFFNQGKNAQYDPQVYTDGTVPTLVAKGPAAVQVRYIVRRLTPLECERLQGYPDGWTDIGEWVDSKGKKHKEADSPRYKALGNSIALPPWKWVLKRLCACYERDVTMASLFDGIGGFPYIWEQLNGKGSCLWASEIEEFPMAVTKLRFGG